jgi:hypothetical protein
VAFAPTIDLF